MRQRSRTLSLAAAPVRLLAGTVPKKSGFAAVTGAGKQVVRILTNDEWLAPVGAKG